jgi:hypothetical protein
LITGATEGLGLELARVFAANGHSLVLVARRDGVLADIAACFEALYGVTVWTHAVDLCAADAVRSLKASLDYRGIVVDILVNNAGVGSFQRLDAQHPGEVGDIVMLNARVAAELIAVFLPGMRDRGCGGIINVASLAAFVPVPLMAAYAGTKSFILSLTRSLAAELRGSGVTVCVVTLGLAAWTFVLLSGSWPIALLGAFLFGRASHAPDFVPATTPLVVSQFCAVLGFALLAAGYASRRARTFAASGLAFGMAALVTPHNALLAAFVLVAIICVAARTMVPRTAIAATAAFLLGVTAAVLPWSVRNVQHFGDPALTDDLGTHDLALRLGYNGLGVSEWTSAVALATPTLGTSLLVHLVPVDIRDNLDLGVATGTLMVGYRARLLSVSGDTPFARYVSLVADFGPSDVVRHILAMPPVLWRGHFGGSGLIGLVGLLLFAPFLRIHARRGLLAPVLLLIAPIVGLAIVTAGVSHNLWWYNLLMPLVLAYVVAYIAGSL